MSQNYGYDPHLYANTTPIHDAIVYVTDTIRSTDMAGVRTRMTNERTLQDKEELHTRLEEVMIRTVDQRNNSMADKTKINTGKVRMLMLQTKLSTEPPLEGETSILVS